MASQSHASAPSDVPALSVADATRRFGARVAVESVSLAIDAGELVAVLGPSGSGKSTLLRLIAGFERPDAGSVTINGTAVAGDGVWVEPERRRVGLVPQGDSLFPHLSVGENVAFGIGRDRTRVMEMLELVGLADRANSAPRELSGGERQRVALARALAPKPALMLFDEPFSSLDAELRVRLRSEVAAVLRASGATTVWVTHDQEEALALADRVVLLRAGRVVQTATPNQLYWEPADLWTAGFLGDLNVVPATTGHGGVETAIGTFMLAGGLTTGKEVGLRPESIAMRCVTDASAHVAGREFRGRDVLYEVAHPALGTLRVQRPSFELIDVGERVELYPAEGARAIHLTHT
ncbi:MAG: ABC transporter ATP-binding protein [Acidimicrobiales bacterium]|nr:ABC transporter ATP-binding protein [Acidimicrobiales bacterium]